MITSMRNIPKRTLAVAFASFGVLVLSASTFFGGWWWMNHLEQQLYDTKVAAKRGEDERRQFASLGSLASDTTQDRARLETYIVADQEVIQFLSELEQIALANNVRPETREISTQPIDGETIFEKLIVSIGLSGTPASIKEVLRDYERMPYQVRVESFGIHGASGGTGADVVISATKFTAP